MPTTTYEVMSIIDYQPAVATCQNISRKKKSKVSCSVDALRSSQIDSHHNHTCTLSCVVQGWICELVLHSVGRLFEKIVLLKQESELRIFEQPDSSQITGIKDSVPDFRNLQKI